LMDYVNSLDLVSLGDGRILAVETQEAPRRMVYRRDTGLLLLSSDGRSILSAPDILEPGP
jgi:hypothetical protein